MNQENEAIHWNYLNFNFNNIMFFYNPIIWLPIGIVSILICILYVLGLMECYERFCKKKKVFADIVPNPQDI
jgi:hypothetical protein